MGYEAQVMLNNISLNNLMVAYKTNVVRFIAKLDMPNSKGALICKFNHK